MRCGAARERQKKRSVSFVASAAINLRQLKCHGTHTFLFPRHQLFAGSCSRVHCAMGIHSSGAVQEMHNSRTAAAAAYFAASTAASGVNPATQEKLHRFPANSTGFCKSKFSELPPVGAAQRRDAVAHAVTATCGFGTLGGASLSGQIASLYGNFAPWGAQPLECTPPYNFFARGFENQPSQQVHQGPRNFRQLPPRFPPSVVEVQTPVSSAQPGYDTMTANRHFGPPHTYGLPGHATPVSAHDSVALYWGSDTLNSAAASDMGSETAGRLSPMSRLHEAPLARTCHPPMGLPTSKLWIDTSFGGPPGPFQHSKPVHRARQAQKRARSTAQPYSDTAVHAPSKASRGAGASYAAGASAPYKQFVMPASRPAGAQRVSAHATSGSTIV